MDPAHARPLLFDDLVVGQDWPAFEWPASPELGAAWRTAMGELAPPDDELAFPTGLLLVMFSNYMDAKVPPRPPGMIYAKQALHFGAPVRSGDLLTTRVSVERKSIKRGRRVVELRSRTRNQRGDMVLEGLRTVIWGA